ncbi:stannin isoform X1 [Aquila chrysaetos chrysaetos]|uniref:stannin isoform X1 n=1 Tax=Aquila chrysaetos chrysaetos TaxID=223781 RepID=UPI001B7D468C|nr:stannin isoform X1 [Aquila chrysaetos chrysaetos]
MDPGRRRFGWAPCGGPECSRGGLGPCREPRRGPRLGEGPALGRRPEPREQRRGRPCLPAAAPRAGAAPSRAPRRRRRRRSLCLRRPGGRARRPGGGGLRAGPCLAPERRWAAPQASRGPRGGRLGAPPAGPGPGGGPAPSSRAARPGARRPSRGAVAAAVLRARGDASRLVGGSSGWAPAAPAASGAPLGRSGSAPPSLAAGGRDVLRR